MTCRPSLIQTLCVFSLSVALPAFALTSTRAFAGASPAAAFDKDHDGTLDLAEVKDAAGAQFDKLEKDSDATLDRKEIGRRLSKKEFKVADPDDDATLTKDEYLELAEKRFDEADANKDGVLDAKELESKAGRSLLRLMR